MKIKLDDKHFLCSDQFCYWITTKVTTEKGTQHERNLFGYYPTAKMAIERFIEKQIMSSDAEYAAVLALEIEDLKKMVRKWKDPFEKGEKA